MTDITKLAQEILLVLSPSDLQHDNDVDEFVVKAQELAQAVILLYEQPLTVQRHYEEMAENVRKKIRKEAKAEQREKFAKMCDAKAKRAKENELYPAFCLNAVAETAEELAQAIREEK